MTDVPRDHGLRRPRVWRTRELLTEVSAVAGYVLDEQPIVVTGDSRGAVRRWHRRIGAPPARPAPGQRGPVRAIGARTDVDEGVLLISWDAVSGEEFARRDHEVVSLWNRHTRDRLEKPLRCVAREIGRPMRGRGS